MSALEEEAVDWGDVDEPTTTVEAGQEENVDQEGLAEDGDDVISLGGVEELEEEVAISAPVEEPVAKVVEAATTGKVEEAEKEKEENETKEAPVAAIPEVAPAPVKPLPAGWRTQEARSGGTYYFNTVTGKTTWDFPTEEAVAPAPTPKEPKEVAPEKLGGIQIKGSARGNASDRKEQDVTNSGPRKREADSQPATNTAAGVGSASSTQKRRRSKSPEPAGAEVAREQASSRPTPHSATEKVDQGAVKGGWGRRADIASEANGRRGAENRRPYDNDRRGQRPPTDVRVRDQDSGEQSRRKEDPTDHRSHEYQRGGKQAPNGDRHSLARDERTPRETARATEEQPSAPVKEPVDAATPSRQTDRRSEREGEVSQKARDEERRNAARADTDRSRPTPDRKPRERDTRPAENARRGEGGADTRREREVGPRNDRHSEQRPSSGYSGAGYNYMDRGDGGRPPRGSATPDAAMPPTSGYGPPRGYHPRGRQHEAPYSPVSPVTVPSPGPGRGPPSAGAKPARAWGAQEEKQKRWWNKNSGERKPVSDDATAEADSSSGRRGPRSATSAEPSATRAAPPTDRTTDRERELAEREAAIARKEKELGLR